ncbi:hypothetical protein C8J57DRAFT_253525 [Mycena rebaudengoi]|nr:hypothetical protein C8J57DRAFT_253525 [Mycena rebaudengoi]
MNASETQLWLGFLLAGSWLNMSLYTVELSLGIFFLRKWQLSRLYRWGFWVVLANDAIGTLAVCTNIALTLIEGAASAGPGLSVLVLLLSTSLSALIEQTFLIHRYWKVTRNHFITTFLMLPVAGHVVIAIISVVSTVITPNTGDTRLDLDAVGAVVCTIGDVFIASALVHSLSRLRPAWRSTKELVHAVCINAMASGAVVAVVTILSMITLLLNGVNAIIFSPFFAIMGRAYSLTIILNVVVHNTHRPEPNSLHVSSMSVPGMTMFLSTRTPAARAPERDSGETDDTARGSKLNASLNQPQPQSDLRGSLSRRHSLRSNPVSP